MKGFRKIVVLMMAAVAAVGMLSACSSLKPFTQDELSRISGVPLEQTSGLAK